uniref:Leucine rich repeat containing G protein-coupled receptor 6 n=1 Tax=Scleropages formosus TaxID=113540 RepID=A0A8C9R233_SCLFO
MRNLLLVCSLLQFCSTSLGNGISALTPSKLLCPSVCQCEMDSALLLVDCSERRLTAVPPCLSSHTSILDLSTNNISELQPKAFKSLHRLEELMLQNNQLERLPSAAVWDLPNLLSLRLDANLIPMVPDRAFLGLRSLRHLWLDDNALTEVPVHSLAHLPSLQALTLAMNGITHIPSAAFHNLSSLVVLKTTGKALMGPSDLVYLHYMNHNALHEIPVAVKTLAKLRELGLHNNKIRAIPEEAFAGNMFLHTIPRRLQLCVVTSKSIISENLDLEEFLLEAEDKLQVDIYCTPIPGPFRPCRYLFDSWIVRVGIWAITLTSLVCNSLLVWTAVSPSGCHSPVKVLVGSIAGANFLTGLCTGTLALVDAWTFGEFSQHGTWWESGPLCQLIGFISVFSSEASILFLGLAILFCSFTASHLRVYDKFHFTHIRAGIVVCVVLSLAIATLPVLKVGRYSMSPLCLPTMLQEGQSSTLSFTAGLIIANALCFMLITVTIIKLLWHMSKCYSVHLTNFAMIKHLAWLVFSNVLIYSPIICLTFSSLIGRLHISSEIVKSIQLVLMHLPASLNPLLYILFSPYLVDDLHQLWKTSLSTQPRTLHLFYMRQSMQTLVPIPDVDVIFDTCHGTKPKSSNKKTCPVVTVTPCLPSSPLPQHTNSTLTEQGSNPHPLTSQHYLLCHQATHMNYTHIF